MVSPENIYIQITLMKPIGCIYVFMCLNVHCIYVTKIIKEKRCHTYEKEGAWEDLGRKNEQDIDVILFSF